MHPWSGSTPDGPNMGPHVHAHTGVAEALHQKTQLEIASPSGYSPDSRLIYRYTGECPQEQAVKLLVTRREIFAGGKFRHVSERRNPPPCPLRCDRKLFVIYLLCNLRAGDPSRAPSGNESNHPQSTRKQQEPPKAHQEITGTTQRPQGNNRNHSEPTRNIANHPEPTRKQQ